MQRTLVAVVVLAVLAAGLPAPAGATHGGSTIDCSYPITVTDATGASVTVGEEPQRVVVLAPSGAQTMWEIGAQDKVVGMPVNAFTSYLEGSESRTNVVGSQGRPVNERVLAQDPDLVIASGINRNQSVRALRNLSAVDFPVVKMPAESSLTEVYWKIQTIGRLVGASEAATATAADMKGTVQAVRTAVEGRERPTVYYALGGGFTAGPDTYIGHLIDTAGGNNVAAAANISRYAPISNEVLVQEDPDWILVSSGTSVPSGPAINSTTAIREDQVLRVDANFLNQAGPKNVIPLEAMASAWYPDAGVGAAIDDAEAATVPQCAAAHTTPTPTTTSPTTTQPTTTQATTAPPSTTTTGGGGPGFTATAGVVALLGAALLGRRLR